MPRLKNEIIAEIDEHVRKNGGEYVAWCVGIAHDPESELFRIHEIEEFNDLWIYREAYTVDAARAVRDHFAQVRGTEPGVGPEREDGRFVYVYKNCSQPGIAAANLHPMTGLAVKQHGT